MQTSINESADKEIQAQLLEEHNQPNDPDNEDNTDQLVGGGATRTGSLRKTPE